MRRFLTILLLCLVGATAVSAQKVRVMSYNVKNGIGMDGIKSIERCAAVIRKVQPDIVAIQEVDSMTRRNKKYVLGELAKHAGYPHAYFGKAIPYQGGAYGIGVLSKEKALSVKIYLCHANESLAHCLWWSSKSTTCSVPTFRAWQREMDTEYRWISFVMW